MTEEARRECVVPAHSIDQPRSPQLRSHAGAYGGTPPRAIAGGTQSHPSRTAGYGAVRRIDIRIVAKIGPYKLTHVHLDTRENSCCKTNQDGGSQDVPLRIDDFLRKCGDAVE